MAASSPRKKAKEEDKDMKNPDEEDAARSGEKAASQVARGSAAKQPRISRIFIPRCAR